MKILVVGINHKKTPLQIREKLSFNTEEQVRTLAVLRDLEKVKECILLSTCNRTEVYICSDEEDVDGVIIEKVLCDVKKQNLYELKKYFYTYEKRNAIKHLFKVACGLDSMVLGEDQILGQVKAAHKTAMEAGTTSSVLNTLFREAITAAKEIKTITELSRNSVSVGSLAVKCISEQFSGELSGKCILLIGRGEIGSVALKNLCSKNPGKIYVTYRSHSNSEGIAGLQCNVHPVPYEQRYSVMDECDAVISATSSPHYTITRDLLEQSIKTGKKRVFVDLAVPRDIDETVGEIEGCSYFDMDRLETVLDENFGRRAREAVKAEEMIEGYVMDYEKWLEFRKVLPIVKDIQKYAEELAREKTEAAVGRLRNASEEDKEEVKSAIRNTINEMLNKFVYSIRENGSKEDIKTYFSCLKEAVKEKT